MAKEFVNEADANRYAMHIDGKLIGVLDYRIVGDSISLTRAFTQPTHRGQGLAAELMEYAVNDIEANSQHRVIPMCWYASQWFDEHPERADLLSR